MDRERMGEEDKKREGEGQQREGEGRGRVGELKEGCMGELKEWWRKGRNNLASGAS